MINIGAFMKLKMMVSLLGLFFIYSIFCLFRPPMVSDSIIILSIGGLFAFIFYLLHTEKVEVPKVLTPEMEELEKMKLQKELLNIQYDIAKIHNANNSIKKQEQDALKKFIF